MGQLSAEKLEGMTSSSFRSVQYDEEPTGEVEGLIYQLDDSVSNLEKELEMLVSRLQNVTRRQNSVEDERSDTVPSERDTPLGGRIDSVLYRTNRIAHAIRQVRESLGN